VGNNNSLDNIDFITGDALGNPLLIERLNHLPEDNYSELAGGNFDGPHVDQKTARIVGPEERLYLDVTATVLSQVSSTTNEVPFTLACITDLRILGTLRTNAGNRRNASR